MEDINGFAISGNLTKDAEVRQTKDGYKVTRFTLASNKRKKVNGDYVERPCFYNFYAFGNYGAAIAESMKKGVWVVVQCEPAYSEWESDGKKQSKIEFEAIKIRYIPKHDTGLYDDDCPF